MQDFDIVLVLAQCLEDLLLMIENTHLIKALFVYQLMYESDVDGLRLFIDVLSISYFHPLQ